MIDRLAIAVAFCAGMARVAAACDIPHELPDESGLHVLKLAPNDHGYRPHEMTGLDPSGIPGDKATPLFVGCAGANVYEYAEGAGKTFYGVIFPAVQVASGPRTLFTDPQRLADRYQVECNSGNMCTSTRWIVGSDGRTDEFFYLEEMDGHLEFCPVRRPNPVDVESDVRIQIGNLPVHHRRIPPNSENDGCLDPQETAAVLSDLQISSAVRIHWSHDRNPSIDAHMKADGYNDPDDVGSSGDIALALDYMRYLLERTQTETHGMIAPRNRLDQYLAMTYTHLLGW